MIGVIFFWYVLLLLTGMYSHVMRALVSDLVHKRTVHCISIGLLYTWWAGLNLTADLNVSSLE